MGKKGPSPSVDFFCRASTFALPLLMWGELPPFRARRSPSCLLLCMQGATFRFSAIWIILTG